MSMLPKEFAALEPFAPRWCLATERERFAQRMAGPMESLQEFYDAFFPCANEAITYLDQYSLDDMPDDALHLLQLLYSLIMVSFPVEAWRQPHVPDSGAAYLDLLIEPIP